MWGNNDPQHSPIRLALQGSSAKVAGGESADFAVSVYKMARKAKISGLSLMRLTEAQYAAILAKRSGKPVARSKRPPDPLPLSLAEQCARAGLERPKTEYRFAEGRRFRADCFFIDAKLIVEVQGAVHRIKGRFQRDRERSQVIAALGYRVMFVSPQDVRNGNAVEAVRKALLNTKSPPVSRKT